MLENIIFILGLSLFGIVILLSAIQAVISSFYTKCDHYGKNIIIFSNTTNGLMMLLVWLCFALSYLELVKLVEIVPLDLDYYYEMLYWSGGHLLQFIYTQILMVSLLIIGEAIKQKELKFTFIYEMILILNFCLASSVLIGHLIFDFADGSFKNFFTLHMIYTSGVAPTSLILILSSELLHSWYDNIHSEENYLAISYIAAIILFLFGGLIGIQISEINVTIPAHYHGMVVAITIALMGLIYFICFAGWNNIDNLSSKTIINYIFLNLTRQNIKSSRLVQLKQLASWQIITLIIGQLIHITGLYLAGGYGVMRKIPGEEIALSAKIYMGMMGVGGLIAIIGGLMFVYICARSLCLK